MTTTQEPTSGVVAPDDARILQDVRRALVEEPLLGDCCVHPDGKGDAPRAALLFPEGYTGFISIAVENGVVTLDGEVDSLCEKRFAGAIALTAPGARRVLNELEAPPDASGSEDDALAGAVEIVLDRDPALDARDMRVSARGRIVTLTGRARSRAEAQRAELVAKRVFGVDDVRNRLKVDDKVGRA